MNISKLRILPAIIAIALFAVATQWMLTLPLSAQDTELATEIGRITRKVAHRHV